MISIMRSLRTLIITAFIPALAGQFSVTAQEDQILVAAQIDGKPATLGFDTGAESSCLFRGATDRFGLKVSTMDFVEHCTLSFGKVLQTATFEVVDSPYPSFHGNLAGLIGWTSVSNRVTQLDAEKGGCRISDEPSPGVEKWTRWKLVERSPVLIFERENGAIPLRIGVDTGFAGGIMLSPDRWQRWRKRRAGLPATVEAHSSIEGQLNAAETFRAKKISVGDLTVTDVPVLEISPSLSAAFLNCDALLGLFVFRRLKLVVDGKNGVVYTRPLARPAGRYDYNPLGADFVPANLQIPVDSNQPPELIACVIDGGPASRAGVKNGDVLLKAGNHDADEIWRGLLNRSEEARGWPPAGTKVKLTMSRNGQQYETIVTLNNLQAVN